MNAYQSVSFDAALRTPLGLSMRGDGPPHWREGPDNKPPIAATEARRQRRLLIRLLVPHGEDGSHVTDLVRRLRACSLLSPCGSGACAVCWRAMRRIVLHASRDLFRESGRYQFVTCISASDEVEHNQMHSADPLAAVERRLMKIAARCRVRILGGLDISSNEHRQHRFRPHYSSHGHVLVPARNYDEATWKQHFPSDSLLAPRALLVEPYDGRRRLIAYCLHPIIERRDSEAAYIAMDGTTKRANTRDKPLRRPQRLELALMLDRVGIEARIISYGYDLVTDGDDIWMVEVDQERANELLAERRQRRAARREEHLQKERESIGLAKRLEFWL